MGKSQDFFGLKPWIRVSYRRIVQTWWPKSSSEIWRNNSKPTPTSFRGFFRWHLPLGCYFYDPQHDTREMRFPKNCEGRRSKNTIFAHQFFDFMPNNFCSSIAKRNVNGPEDPACTQKKIVFLLNKQRDPQTSCRFQTSAFSSNEVNCAAFCWKKGISVQSTIRSPWPKSMVELRYSNLL